MSSRIASLIESYDGVAVISRYDQPTGTWIFICLHNDTLGQMTGGTRMQHYPDPADGLLDGMRLSHGMTHKWAALGMAFGGAKSVMAVREMPTGEERRGLLLRYGQLLESFGGIFATGEDMGTTPEDFEVIAEQTHYLHGFDPETRQKLDPGPYTARAVFAGIEAAAAETFGEGLAGKRVLVQGTGHVGARLVEMLDERGAHVLVSDINTNAAEEAAAGVGGTVVPVEEVYQAECDIYSPCAVGATLNEETIPQLRCRLVAGSANNQLARPEDGERLHQRGIAYAPDYIINAGGAMAFGLLTQGQTDLEAIMGRMSDVGTTVGEVLREARERDESPVISADRRVHRTLDRARAANAN
jgi:leucine dehydrogenase